MKLIFEGCGWKIAKHNGVGNCRIRTTFLNKYGVKSYLELNGTQPHKWSPEYAKAYQFMGWVSHHIIGSKNTNLENFTFEYDVKNILKLVNSIEVGGSFDSIEVRNKNWNGFKIDGSFDEEIK